MTDGELRRALSKREVESVRFSFADQHGILRGKTLVAEAALAALDDGVRLPSSLLAKDTAHRTILPVWDANAPRALRGVPDVTLIADPATYRVLPWAPKTGWLLCDLHDRDGAPIAMSPRAILRRQLERLAARRYRLLVGLEVELHLFALEDDRIELDDAGQPGAPPRVRLLTTGYQHLTEQRYDAVADLLDALREQYVALALPIRSLEVEYGPSQFEVTFAPLEGLAAADAMVLFRTATKQLARRAGYHASFMCRPKIPSVMSSGWHLHQSLVDAGGANAFATAPGSEALLSPLALAFLGGLLANAAASVALAAPTINAYRRYRPNSLAPDRATWAHDSRGAMVRAVGSPGAASTHLENRLGEPAANPYLYVASQIIAGLDGIDRGLDPGPPTETPYAAEAPRLPTTLDAALDALAASPLLRAELGEEFVETFLAIKRAEIARFNADVTEWEHREYFDVF